MEDTLTKAGDTEYVWSGFGSLDITSSLNLKTEGERDIEVTCGVRLVHFFRNSRPCRLENSLLGPCDYKQTRTQHLNLQESTASTFRGNSGEKPQKEPRRMEEKGTPRRDR